MILKKNFLTVKHAYPDFHLTMHSYICTSTKNDISLLEHIDYQWLHKAKLDHLDWAAADIPIVEKLSMS